jgi:hypothetical protein
MHAASSRAAVCGLPPLLLPAVLLAQQQQQQQLSQHNQLMLLSMLLLLLRTWQGWLPVSSSSGLLLLQWQRQPCHQ